MTARTTTLAIDLGARYIGLALVEHDTNFHNRVRYAATLVVESRPLQALVENRAGTRRSRRTRKTHVRRLRRLRQALGDVPHAEAIVRFCRRRGYSYDVPEERDEQTFQISRQAFFEALHVEIDRLIPAGQQQRVKDACARHLNLQRRPTRELRSSRFENRGRSRCGWEGCRLNVPRARNDVRGQLQELLFLWLQPVFGESQNVPRLQRSLQHWIDELAALSQSYRATTDADQKDAPEHRRVKQRISRVFKLLRERIRCEASPATAAQFEGEWKDQYRPQVSEIVRGTAAGRVRYCQQHATLFVDYVMAGRPIPNRQEVHDRDLISRTRQILYRRLARLVEGRILPLAGGRIDKVVVERGAFDVPGRPVRIRRILFEDKAVETDRQGPQAGFASREKMLDAEFDGRCAYCGEQVPTTGVEPICQPHDFPFNAYFNVVPACRTCLARKGSRTALEAGLTVHAAACDAYGRYLHSLPGLHPYHTIKQEMLWRLQRVTPVDRAPEIVGLIAGHLVSVTHTQPPPRPLARYLATQVERLTGKRPTIESCAARHTARYRSLILPASETERQQAARDLRSHAVAAILLACDLPSAAALENSQWNQSRSNVEAWRQHVQAAAPEIAEGLPRVEPPEFVRFFENDAGAGYCTIDLGAFNWNRRRKAAHKLDPYGTTGQGVPVKRIPAAAVFAGLQKGPAVRDRQIAAIAHRTLRTALAHAGAQAGAALVAWLQQSTRAGLANGNMSAHPADCQRRRLLETFVNTPVADFLRTESPAAIPWVIGVRCLSQDTGASRQVNVRRRLPGEAAVQFYRSQASVREMYVGYRAVDKKIDRRHPVLFAVSQTDAVSRGKPGEWRAIDAPPESPLGGRTLGTGASLRAFREQWKSAFADFCRAEGIARLFKLSQGCVIEKLDGSTFQVRNFDRSEPWMSAESLKDIRRIHRSPFRVME